MPDREEDFLSTRRIDIPPDVRDLIERSAPPGSPETRRHKVIRIPKAQTAIKPLGSPDFQVLLENIYDAVLITDKTGHIHGANNRATQFFYRDVADLCRHNILDLISGASTELLQSIQETLQSDRFVLIQAYCARNDGSFFPAEISVNRLPLGETEYLSFFVRDVTVRKQAENQLRTGYTAIQNAASGIVIADINGIVLYANPAICRFWSISRPDDLVGKDLRSLLPDSGFVEHLLDAAKRGETSSTEIEYQDERGKVSCAQLSAAPNFDTEGDFAGIVLSLLDITSLKEAQKQLQKYADELREKNLAMEDDLRMAREVQIAFLPRDIRAFPIRPISPGNQLVFTSLYLPSGLVGGDFYDVIPLSDSQVGILIADVVGHGMRAALVVATLRGLIEQLLVEAKHPAVFLTRLNEAYTRIFRQTDERMFATLFYGMCDTTSGSFEYSCAGHLPPYVLHPCEDVAESLEVTGAVQGPAIGLYANATYEAARKTFKQGDVLLLYTDGISECMNADYEFFDTTRFAACLRRNLHVPVEQMLENLVADARDFTGRTEFEDDVCLLAIRFGASK